MIKSKHGKHTNNIKKKKNKMLQITKNESIDNGFRKLVDEL